METGKLLYETKRRIGFLFLTLIIFCQIWIPLLFSSKVQFSWEEHAPLVLITIFFIGFGGVVALTSKKNKKFYEHGIGHFKRNKLTHFEPYETFVLVECYHKRTKGSSKHRDSHYCLAFWRADASYVELSLKNDRRALKTIWEEILFHCPSLKSRFVCYLIDPNSQKLYEFLYQQSH